MTGSRYRVARAMGDAEFVKVVKEDEELLKGFGLKLLSVESGVRAVPEGKSRGGRVNPWDIVTFEDANWTIVRPLLEELQELRLEVSQMKIAAK